MIQLLEYPAENQVLLDGNNTVVKVMSTGGIGSYFIVKIYIDGVLFDTQGWSREDDFTAKKDLIYLYHAYFKSVFSGSMINGVSEQTNLKKPVYLEFEEYDFATDTLQDSITSPHFHIMYSVKPEAFDNEDILKLLNISTVNRNHSKGKIVVPFYAKTTNQEIKIELFDDLINSLFSVIMPANTPLEKRVFLYQMDLSTLTILSSCRYLTLKITIGSVEQTLTYKLIHLPNYPIKEVMYQNNFGFFLPAYFDGDFEDNTGFKIDSYENSSSENVIYNIDQEGSYIINCGNLNNQECSIVGEISKSLKTYFLNNNQYLSINTATKKTTEYKDRQNIYAQDLQFTFKKDAPISNAGLNVDEISPYIHIDNVQAIEIVDNGYPTIVKYKIHFRTNTNPTTINWKTRAYNFNTIIESGVLDSVTSPVFVECIALLGLSYFQLDFTENNVTYYSNHYVPN